MRAFPYSLSHTDLQQPLMCFREETKLRNVTPRWCAFLVAVLVILAAPVLFAQQGEPNVPPQFTTHPIHGPMEGQILVNGHVIFVPEVAGSNIGAAPGRPPGGNGGGGNPPGGGGGGTDFGQPGAVAGSVLCFPNSTNNFDASCASDSYQGETMTSPDATRNKLVGAENDIYPGACNAGAANGGVGDCAVSSTVSSNGQSWQRFKLSRTWGGHAFLITFDPSVAVDSAGRYFVAFGMSDGGANSANGIAAVSSSDGGSTWVKTNPVTLNLSGSKFDDKMWIAADGNASSPFANRLYVAWDRNQSNNQILYVSASGNQGQTWTAPVKINDGTSKFERVIYAFPAVAPNGTLYVLWLDYAKNKIFIDYSTDGGTTWHKDVAAASTNIGFGVDIGCDGGRSMTPAPQMAISRTLNGQGFYDIYIVYANNAVAPGSGTDLDVYLTKSSNGGANWSTPVRLSSTSTGQQYNPAIAIDAFGTINVSYLDRRDDVSNCRTNTYLSRSTNGGTSFTDSKVTDNSSDFDGNANGPGDYQGLACLSSTAFPYMSTHWDANVALQTGTAGAFEIYSALK